MKKKSSLDGFSMESAFKATDYIVSPRAREKIVVGECVVSADFLQMEMEQNANTDPSRKSPGGEVDGRRHWLEGKLMFNQVEDLSVRGYGVVLPRKSSRAFAEDQEGAYNEKGSSRSNQEISRSNQEQILDIFDAMDIDQDGKISYEELNENLTCYSRIARTLGITSEHDLRNKVDLLFRSEAGEPRESVDKESFVSFFSADFEETVTSSRNESDPSLTLNGVSGGHTSTRSDNDIVSEILQSSWNANSKGRLTTQLSSPQPLQSTGNQNLSGWLNESALDTWTRGSESGNITKISSGANTLVHTSMSSNSESLQDVDSPLFRDVHDLMARKSSGVSNTKPNTLSDGRYHVSSETLMEFLRDETNIALETFLLIPSETSQDTINQALSWPLAKNSFLMEF